jgi:YHS domain-containing protein
VIGATLALLGLVGTMRTDVVDLVEGRGEHAGREEVSAEHEGWRYLFSSETNRSAFLADPARYEIQLGGACARMGPLSGRGKPDLAAVHQVKVYLFASESCRETFLADPSRHLETDLEPPLWHPIPRSTGRALVKRAVEWAGGMERLDRLGFFEERFEGEATIGGKPMRIASRFALAEDGSVRHEESWGEETWSWFASGSEAFFVEPKGETTKAHPQQRRAMERVRDHHLLSVLRSMNRRDFAATSPLPEDLVESGKWPEHPSDEAMGYERTAVYFDGTVRVLAIDPASGRVVRLAYEGRGPGGALGRIEKTYSLYESIDGTTLPVSWTATFEGKPDPSLSCGRVSISTSPDPSAFARPGR